MTLPKQIPPAANRWEIFGWLITGVSLLGLALLSMILIGHPEDDSKPRSTILEFNAVADGSTVTVRVGVARKCILLVPECQLEKLAEIVIDGKIVTSVGVGSMSQKQIWAMEQAMWNAVPPEFRPLVPQVERNL